MALAHVSFANGYGPLIIIINYDDQALFCLCLCYTGHHRNVYPKVVTQIEIGLNIHGVNTLLKRTGVSKAKCSFAIRNI